MQQVIQVGSVVIGNFDNYWKIKKDIEKLEDMLSRGLWQRAEILNTNFAKSVENKGGGSYSFDDCDYLHYMKQAVRIFEDKYPKIYNSDTKQMKLFN